jgi:RNA polymerase sigma factor (sigma-70 family)
LSDGCVSLQEMSEREWAAEPDEVGVLVRRAQMYVKESTLRAVVLERLGALHRLSHADVLRAEGVLRASGVRIDRQAEAVVEDTVVEEDDAYERRAEDVDHDAAAAAARAFLRDVRRLRNPSRRLLTAEEEVGLAVLMRLGTPLTLRDELPEFFRTELEATSEAARAFDALVVHNLRLVWSIAARLAGQAQSLEAEDLVGYGNLGLIRAVQKFDASKGYKFSTYATWWIRQATSRAMADFDRAIRIPVHMVEKINRTRSAYTRIVNRGGRPSLIALAAESGSTVEEVRNHLDLMRGTYSLDAPVDAGGELYLHEVLTADPDVADPAIALEDAGVRGALATVLSELPDREAQVVRMRFGLDGSDPMTLEEIGTNYGLTRERIRQIEAKAMTKLRHPSRSRRLRPFLFDGEDTPDPVRAGHRLAEPVWRLQGEELTRWFLDAVRPTLQESVHRSVDGRDDLKRMAIAVTEALGPQRTQAVMESPLACLQGRTLIEAVRPGVDLRALFGRVLDELHAPGGAKQVARHEPSPQTQRTCREIVPPSDEVFAREARRNVDLLAEVRARVVERRAVTVDGAVGQVAALEPAIRSPQGWEPNGAFPAARAESLVRYAHALGDLAPSEKVLALVHWGHAADGGPPFTDRDLRHAFALAWGKDEPLSQAITRAADSCWIRYDSPTGCWEATSLGRNLVAAAQLRRAVDSTRDRLAPPVEGAARERVPYHGSDALAPSRALSGRRGPCSPVLPPEPVQAIVSPWAPPFRPEPARPSEGGPATPTAEAFLREKQPQTAQERALCFLYWATVVRRSDSTTTGYLDDLNRRTPGRPFSAAGPTLQGLARATCAVVRRGPGIWQVTPRGRLLVEAMPDRGRVAALRAGW